MLSKITGNRVRYLAAVWPVLIVWVGLAGVFQPLPVSAQTQMHQNVAPPPIRRGDVSRQASALNRSLCRAAGAGRLVEVRKLVADGADINAAQQNGWTALMLAASYSHASIVKFLLDHGADPNRRSALYNDVDALILAAQAGNAAICCLLLDHGVNVNEPDVDGDTVLMYVVGNTNIPPVQVYRVTKYLLSRGATVQVKDKLGNTPLSVAQNAAKVDPRLSATANLLLAHSASKAEIRHGVPRHVINRQLLKAAERGDLEAVRNLVTKGANVNAVQENGWTALMLAARDSHVSVVKYLLAHGADVHRRSVLYNDVDALTLAAEAGNVPICRMLLAHGANVNETDVSGNTPLMLALENGNLTPKQEYDIAKFLLKKGAEVNARNRFRQTALDYTERSRFEPPLTGVVKLLIAAGGKK